MTTAKHIPEGFQSVTPNLTFKDTKKALEFYEKALGATVLEVLPMPDGKGTMHATMKIGNSILMMGDEMPNCPSAESLGGTSISLFVYVPDVDAAFKKAIAAGATETMPVMDMFWGDRCGNLTDPFGYTWMIGTHVRDMTPEEIQEGARAFFEMMGNQ
jgi:uncharacterized glyoxalase superfamily protein PhnB